DPLPPAWDPATAALRVRSTLGQHIFLGGYLVILIPLTAARLMALSASPSGEVGPRARPFRAATAAVWIAGALPLVGLAARARAGWGGLAAWGALGGVAWPAAARGADARSGPAATVSLWSLLLAQVLVLALSRARGPQLGLLVGLAAGAFALFGRRGSRRAMIATAVALAAVIAFLALLNVPGSPVAPLARLPRLERLRGARQIRPRTAPGGRVPMWG